MVEWLGVILDDWLAARVHRECDGNKISCNDIEPYQLVLGTIKWTVSGWSKWCENCDALN